MRVRPKKRASPQKKPDTAPIPAQAYGFPAPIRGLVLNDNISNPAPGGALVLDNWTVTENSIRARGGTAIHVPLPAAVATLFSYSSGVLNKFFGATATTIYDISTAGIVTPPVAVSGQTNGRYATEQFGTPGGDFLYAVNGIDEAQLYDGATWTQINGTSTPAVTAIGTEKLSHVWSYANRLFFVEKNTMKAWYLPVDSIGGAAVEFSLAGIFKKGGSLLFGATWSLDAGDGLDDKCIFVSTEGEVAVYSGTNPGSASDWSKDGVYNITKPLGPRGTMPAGGDLLIATENGLVPVSGAITKDIAALEMSAVSRNISPLWQDQVDLLGGGDWQVVKWARENIMVISQPNDPTGSCLVANLQNGGWSRWTGIDTNCMGLFTDSVFYGDRQGNVVRMESGGTDMGVNYTCVYLGLHEGMGMPQTEKTILQARPTFKTGSDIRPFVSVKKEFDRTISLAPSAAPNAGGEAVWDVAKWDEAVWDGGAAQRTVASWQSTGVTGYNIAPEVQLTFGNVIKPNVEFVGVEVTYTSGALVT